MPDDELEQDRKAEFDHEQGGSVTPLITFGQGAPPEFVKWVSGRYVDLAEVFGHTEAYHDFEGFAGPEHTEEILTNPQVEARLTSIAGLGERYVEMAQVIATLLTHFAYENEDQGDHQIDVNEALVFIDTMEWLLTCRFWMKKDAPEASEETS